MNKPESMTNDKVGEILKDLEHYEFPEDIINCSLACEEYRKHKITQARHDLISWLQSFKEVYNTYGLPEIKPRYTKQEVEAINNKIDNLCDSIDKNWRNK